MPSQISIWSATDLINGEMECSFQVYNVLSVVSENSLCSWWKELVFQVECSKHSEFGGALLWCFFFLEQDRKVVSWEYVWRNPCKKFQGTWGKAQESPYLFNFFIQNTDSVITWGWIIHATSQLTYYVIRKYEKEFTLNSARTFGSGLGLGGFVGFWATTEDNQN